MEESYWVFIEGTRAMPKKQKNNQQTKNNNNKNSSSMMNLLLISKGRYAGMYTEVYSWKSIFIYLFIFILTC